MRGEPLIYDEEPLGAQLYIDDTEELLGSAIIYIDDTRYYIDGRATLYRGASIYTGAHVYIFGRVTSIFGRVTI